MTDPNDEIDNYPQPMLLDQLGYLSGMTRGADQRPGRDAIDRLAELRAKLDGYVARFHRIEDEAAAMQ